MRAAAVGTVHQLHLHTRGGCALTVCGTVFSMTDLGGGHNLVCVSPGVLCTVTDLSRCFAPICSTRAACPPTPTRETARHRKNNTHSGSRDAPLVRIHVLASVDKICPPSHAMACTSQSTLSPPMIYHEAVCCESWLPLVCRCHRCMSSWEGAKRVATMLRYGIRIRLLEHGSTV